MRFEDKDYIILEDADRWLMPNFKNPGVHWENVGLVKAQLSAAYDKHSSEEFADFEALREATDSLGYALSLYVGRPETSYIKQQQMDLEVAEGLRKALDYAQKAFSEDNRDS